MVDWSNVDPHVIAHNKEDVIAIAVEELTGYFSGGPYDIQDVDREFHKYMEENITLGRFENEIHDKLIETLKSDRSLSSRYESI